MPELTSAQNPRVKATVRLRDRSERDAAQLFLIEGYRELLRAVDSRYPIKELFVCPSLFLGNSENALIARLQAQNVPIFHCSSSVFHKLSYRDRPDGLLAVASQQHLTLQSLHTKLFSAKNGPKLSPPLLLIAESIEK